MSLVGIHVKLPALPSAHDSSRVPKYVSNEESSSALSWPDVGSNAQRRPTEWEGRREGGREGGREEGGIGGRHSGDIKATSDNQ